MPGLVADIDIESEIWRWMGAARLDLYVCRTKILSISIHAFRFSWLRSDIADYISLFDEFMTWCQYMIIVTFALMDTKIYQRGDAVIRQPNISKNQEISVGRGKMRHLYTIMMGVSGR